MIGILAGMGPRSTAPFLERVLDQCVKQYGAQLDEDFPPMMIYSLPTPFRMDAPLDHDAMARCIRRGLDQLMRTGVALIAVPCNVAHLYFDELVKGCVVPLLHLIELTAEAVPVEARSVAILATRPTLKAGLYQKALKRLGKKAITARWLQDDVDELIRGVKESQDESSLNDRWHRLRSRLFESSADCVVLGSTDLTAIPAVCTENSLPIVDSASELAREVVARWRRL